MSAYQTHRISAQDGITLSVREYGTRSSTRTPVVYLPGLTRNAKDFHHVAERICADRRVICIDMRGRGLSDHDPNWQNYNVITECSDIVAVLTALDLHEACFVGVSRGGIQTMVMSAMRPGAIKGAIIVDIGPEIATEGLARIGQYIDRKIWFDSWEDATASLRRLDAAQLPKLTDAEWMAYARRLFREEGGRVTSDYDPNLGKPFEAALAQLKEVSLWPQFEGLRGAPLMLIRGALTDLLTVETVSKMQAAIPAMELVTVPDRGHVPFLDEPVCVTAIDAFLARVDATGVH